MPRAITLVVALLFSLAAFPSHGAAGTLAWSVTTATSPTLRLDTLQGVSNAAHRSALDAAGNLYVAATTFDGTSSCMVFLKYAGTDGQIAWRQDTCPGGSSNFGTALALDASGDVVAAGTDFQSAYVAKLSATTGDAIWTQILAPRNTGNNALAVGVSASGDVRVALWENNVLTVDGFAGSDGSLQFTRELTNTLGSALLAGFAVDASGDTLIAEVDSDGNNTAGRISRLDSAGSLVWQVPAPSESRLTLDASGNLIASTTSAVQKYDAATGALDWTQTGANGATATDADGNIYATGAANRDVTTGEMDVGTWKIGPDGSILWSQVIVDPASHASGTAIALDGRGGVLVAADARESDSTHAAQVIKYSAADGTIEWTAVDQDPNVANFVNSVQADSHGVVELGSAFQQPSGSALGLRVLKYVDPAPSPQDPTITLSSSPNPSGAGSPVAFTVTVGGSAGPATGSVTLQSDGVNIGGCANLVPSGGTYQCSTSALTNGSHAITAQFSGDAAYNAATSSPFTQTVNAPVAKADATITLASSVNPSSTGQDVTFTAAISGGSGTPTGTVTFDDGSNALCTSVALSAGTATCVASSLGAGSHSISASYSGDAAYNAALSDTLTQTVNASNANPTRLFNISTRGDVLTGDNVLIGGFVIGGSASKTVAIVATGPSLSAFGITNPLMNPTLQLVRQSDHAVIAANDDWQTDPNASQLQAAGLAPPDPRESGLAVNLPPGAYTVIVSGVGNTTGVAVIGVFELDHPEVPLVNIATRGLVQGGNDVMIGGFIIQGNAPQTVAITATGPSLAAFGVSNPLVNPQITIVRSSDQSVVAANDDWQADPNAAQLQAKGLAPTDPREAGLLLTLPPGAYTAIVSGVGGATGVSVIGVFNAQ